MGMDEFMNDDDFNLEEEVAALFELWDDQDFAVKVGPEVGPNADALTSLTRGRGPRRGNLEDLLKYWRPIMKKPGGFRRCVVILWTSRSSAVSLSVSALGFTTRSLASGRTRARASVVRARASAVAPVLAAFAVPVAV